MTLDARIAIVTGGGRGIGQAIATVLATHGAAVAVWDLDAGGAEETAARIREAGGKAVAITADVSDPPAVRAAAARSREELGPASVLVNNAGISNYVAFTDLGEETWDEMIRVNLKSQYLVTRELVPGMLEAGWGRIVNISSSSTQTGAPRMAHYVASKGGVIGLTKALAMEFADKGITVNTVTPGFVDTPLLRERFHPDQAVASMPMKRAGQPEDIAHAVAYLASEEAGYVTGQTLSVNGGRYLV